MLCRKYENILQFNTILTNLFLLTVVAQVTATMTNSERANYFVSLKSCSINKLQSHMLFTCKNFKFPNFSTTLNCDIIDYSVNLSAQTRVEFLFRVLLGIGALFRVGTPHSRIPLRITLRSCQGEMEKFGARFLRITMSLANNVYRKIYTKRRIVQNFYSA